MNRKGFSLWYTAVIWWQKKINTCWSFWRMRGLWAGMMLPEPALKASFKLLEKFCLICFQYRQASITPFYLGLSFPSEAMLIDLLENTEPYVLEGHLMKAYQCFWNTAYSHREWKDHIYGYTDIKNQLTIIQAIIMLSWLIIEKLPILNSILLCIKKKKNENISISYFLCCKWT